MAMTQLLLFPPENFARLIEMVSMVGFQMSMQFVSVEI